MGYDEATAGRIRALLAKRRDVVERKMFGGLCFMVNGAMCCGLTSEALVVRVGRDAYEAALRERHARPMDFTGRPLVGMVYVDPPGYRTAAGLRSWIDRGVAFVTDGASRTRSPTRSNVRTQTKRRGARGSRRQTPARARGSR